jgi:hypothetical protein
MKGSVKMKQTMNFVRGMGAGMVAGIAVAASVKCMCDKNKKLHKTTGRAAKAVSEIMGDIERLLN